jgi:hypothetical protein
MLMLTKRKLVILARLFFGILTLSALAIQFMYLQQNAALNVGNFFSYFTNLSNIFASLVFIMSALYLMTHKQPSVADDIIRGAAALYMTVTGIVYVTLLSGEDLGLLQPWINIVLHYVMPSAVLLDWLYQPQKSTLSTKQTLYWLIFPAAYLTYSLLRGPLANWYPYPFLNPDKVGGYGGVAVYCVAILAVFFAASWLLKTLGNKLPRHIA